MTYALQIETSAPRPGRRFEPVQERMLHQVALGAVESLPGAARGLVVVPEFAGPIGIPDFTAFVGPRAGLAARQASSVPAVLNEVDAGIVSATYPRRALASSDIAERLGWPLATVAGQLRRLVTTGALIQSPLGFVRAPELVSHGRLYAIEAKVVDWRSALRQVRTYRVWADGYVLVMSGVSDRSLESLRSEVERDRGGLVLDGRWIVRPRLGAVVERRRLQAAELFAVATRSGLEGPALAGRVEA